MTRPAFDWDGVMRACMSAPARGGLGWSPRDFWAATPREVALALGRNGGPMTPPGRGALEALLASHPDMGPGARGQEPGEGNG